MAKSEEEIRAMTPEQRERYYKNVEQLKRVRHEFTKEDMEKSQKSRRENLAMRKETQRITDEIMSSKAKDQPHFRQLALKLGLQPDKVTVKEVFVLNCILGGAKHAKLGDLGTMQTILGEAPIDTTAQEEENAQNALVDAIKGFSKESKVDEDK